MEQFASGWKRSYYGKGDVIVYRLDRHAAGERFEVFGANVLMLVYGDAFWPTYTTGDNTGLIATDSMKNFIQRETQNFEGSDLESYCRFLATKFMRTYAQVEGIRVSAVEIPYKRAVGRPMSVTFEPAGQERSTAHIETDRTGIVEVVSGFRGFRLLRLGGSAFRGFVRDQYTTLPEIENRPLHMWMDLEWRYTDHEAAFSDGAITGRVHSILLDTFEQFESGSIQQVIYKMGTKMLEEIPAIAEIHLEANNRTWDTIAEPSAALGVYTDARPPFGCLGLRLKR